MLMIKSGTSMMIILSLFTGSCFKRGEAGAQEDGLPSKVVGRVLQLTELSDELNLPARVRAETQTEIHGEMEGFIVRRLVSLGQTVRRGQVLFTIESSDALRVYKPLTILSPIAGTINSLPVKVGERVQPTTVLAQIADLSRAILIAEVPASGLDKIKPSLSGWFEFEGKRLAVKVAHVGQSLDPQTGTAGLEFTPLDAGKRPDLVVGALGRVVLHVNPRRSVLVNRSALIEKSDGSFLAVIDQQSIVHHVRVKILNEIDSGVELDAADMVGKTIIAQSSVFVGDGEKVEIQKLIDESSGKS